MTDAVLVDDKLAFYGVATGLALDRDAARIAQESLDAVSGYIDAWRSDSNLYVSNESPAMVMNEAMEYANDELHQLRRIEPGCDAVGVCLSAVWFWGGLAIVGHVGDARVHRLRGIELRRLTHDHVERLGPVPSSRGALTRCLGVHTDARPEVWRERVQAGDRYLIGSAGLHAAVRDDAIFTRALRKGADGAIEALGDVDTGAAMTALAIECTRIEPSVVAAPPTPESSWGRGASA